ncbi:MAG: alpha-glucan family phosphorylase [Desulfovibrio sp.]|jgi:phosphorylase/glycogen(starch) synthase|nr:alpha-glucan family phosphorylase [Desulfovibrio sp.]
MKFYNHSVALFEVSWEVCNKVGGIYSVITSKTLQSVDTFGEDYFLLGPMLPSNPDFEETDEHVWDSIRIGLQTKDLKCRLGRWNIPGRPKTILVDFSKRYASNKLLYELWKNHGVDSLSGGWDYIEPVMFSTACGEVIATIHENLLNPLGEKSVAIFHEWMCGAGLLTLKRAAPSVGTVFTTHATILGRAMASSGRDIYSNMRGINPSREAANHNITAKWSMEGTAAREADAFTTVSDITGEESAVFLSRQPDVITVNGLDLRVIPDFSEDRTVPLQRRARLVEICQRFLRCTLSEKTRFVVISGRYEMHNKGVDVFLEAAGRADKTLAGMDVSVVVLCLIMGGHTGVNPAAVDGDPNASDNGLPFICTHYAWNAPQDPVLNTCRRLGLNNLPENRVKVIFNPAMLNGSDGFFNTPYEEVLSACDVGFFPSWYEPWGYTPQESAAWGVPTVTTDLSGFGLWVRNNCPSVQDGVDGVIVMKRLGTTSEQCVDQLHDALVQAVATSDEDMPEWRRQARAVAEMTSWTHFYENYIQAFRLALERADVRISLAKENRAATNKVFAASSSPTPFLRAVMAIAELPQELIRLRELSRNLWWCWNEKAKSLFMLLNPTLWKDCHNPIRIIEEADPKRLKELIGNEEYMALYAEVMDEFQKYMSVRQQPMGELCAEHPVAYFSTEYGLHESVPIYSGGLGVLSGDHLKSASDMAIPLIGIGLLYKNGYFQQVIDTDGRQVATYPVNNFAHLPVELVYDADNQPVFVQLELPGRICYARVWRMLVGRVTLYLMDTDTRRNTLEDRQITDRLYEANREIRLLQEMVLGIGGVRLIRTLGIEPWVYHMNEGHSAFLVIERLQECMGAGMGYAEAKVRIRANTIFTTHTPVPAGNEAFSLDLMQRYFSGSAANLGLSWQQFVELGQMEGGNMQNFEMTVLALRMTAHANGVSRLHGEVSRHMWNKLWKSLPLAETPIHFVTNGVHVPSYVGPYMQDVLDQHLGPEWISAAPDSPIWSRVDEIPDEAYIAARLAQKETLLDAIRESIPGFASKFKLTAEQRTDMEKILRPETLIIGFARRFAPYKRATLLFADPDRLAKILNNPARPACFVFSGKAHPADGPGIDLIQDVLRMCRDERFLGKIFFLENYSLAVSRIMAQGCDVWLNTPRRPYEASGTSGMKLPVNGGLNLSISDGWWCEGYNRQNGWTIGPVVKTEVAGDDQNDYADAESLYTLLENAVLPLFHERDAATGLPGKWIAMSKRSMKSLTAMYSSNRMLTDYMEWAYKPAVANRCVLAADDWKLCRELSDWQADLARRFSTLKMEEIIVSGMTGNTMTCGDPVTVRVRVHLGEMQGDELLAQMVIGPSYADGNFKGAPELIRLRSKPQDDTMEYSASYIPTTNGQYRYGIRLLPVHKGLFNYLDTGLVLWG